MKTQDEIIKIVTDRIIVGKQIADLYENKKSYAEFIFEVCKLLKGNKSHHFEGYISWLIGEETNELHDNSSGSTHTAICDFDGMIGQYEDELSEENIEHLTKLYRTIMH